MKNRRRSDTDRSRREIDQILEALDGDHSVCGSFNEVLHERAQRESLALESQRGLAARPLAGVAVGIKELFDVAGADNSYGSDTRSGYRAERDSEVVTRLNRAGAVIVGTTRSHEYGWGITTRRTTGASTANPWDTGLVPGGSSGGSAAAVGRGLVALAVASDTGGSIRIPASFCGVLGLKTSWGALSRRGGVSLAPSFDSPGLMARTASMLRDGFIACQGPDPADPATCFAARSTRSDAATPAPWAHSATPSQPLGGLRIGLDVPQAELPHTKSRRRALAELTLALSEAGAVLVDIEGPDPLEMYEVFVPYQMAEAFDVHHRLLGTYPSMADLYGPDVRGRLEAASNVGVGEYLAARRAATDLVARHIQLLDNVDVILRIISTTPPSSIADPDHVTVDGHPVPLRDAVMPTTVAENLTGLPSVTFPFGTDGGTPIGMQITGSHQSELLLLKILERLESIGICTVTHPPTFVH